MGLTSSKASKTRVPETCSKTTPPAWTMQLNNIRIKSRIKFNLMSSKAWEAKTRPMAWTCKIIPSTWMIPLNQIAITSSFKHEDKKMIPPTWTTTNTKDSTRTMTPLSIQVQGSTAMIIMLNWEP